MNSRLLWLPVALSLIAPIDIPSGGAHEASNNGVTVAHPWTRATIAGSKNGAAFGEIKADKASADKLVGARSAAAARAEIHNHVMEKGVAKMRRVENVPIPAGKSVVLSPHGYHIMLLDLKAPLKEGDTLPLTLVFEKAGEITIEAAVEPAGALGPHGFDHQPGHAGHPGTERK